MLLHLSSSQPKAELNKIFLYEVFSDTIQQYQSIEQSTVFRVRNTSYIPLYAIHARFILTLEKNLVFLTLYIEVNEHFSQFR